MRLSDLIVETRRERWRRRIAPRVCRVVGHRWGQKMYGRLCRRCSLYEEGRRA